MAFGKSIRIYLKDGTVTGIKIAEIVNQTIQAVACPRNRVAELATYPEAKRPGIYFLFGSDEVYIPDHVDPPFLRMWTHHS